MRYKYIKDIRLILSRGCEFVNKCSLSLKYRISVKDKYVKNKRNCFGKLRSYSHAFLRQGSLKIYPQGIHSSSTYNPQEILNLG